MKGPEGAAALIGELDKTLDVLARQQAYHAEFVRTDLAQLGRKTSTAIVLAEIFADYYTCLETLFLRISQLFENSLDPAQWHRDLLHKMAIAVPGVRVPILGDETQALLAELLRFRHFKRYYFDIGYDWDRLDFVGKKHARAVPLVIRDLARFREFLVQLTVA
jgi:hypothetical protein